MGYVQALAEAKIELPESFVVEANYDPGAAEKTTDKWMESPKGPSGMVDSSGATQLTPSLLTAFAAAGVVVGVSAAGVSVGAAGSPPQAKRRSAESVNNIGEPRGEGGFWAQRRQRRCGHGGAGPPRDPALG